MALRVIAESLSEEEIAGLKEAIPCDGHQQQRLVNDEIREEGLHRTVIEKPIWVQKKGNSGGQGVVNNKSCVVENSFNLLSELEKEEEGDIEGFVEPAGNEEGPGVDCNVEIRKVQNSMEALNSLNLEIEDMVVTAVYANSTRVERTILWEKLLEAKPNGGDFWLLLIIALCSLPFPTFLSQWLPLDFKICRLNTIILFWLTVRLNWMLPCTGFGLHKLQFKLKRLKANLKWWNSEVFGNIHDNVRKAEENFAVSEKIFDVNPFEVNKLNKAKCQALLFQALNMKEMF
ncbi:hypothetical protein ZIOFF_069915 [Zingiber officinale]|uniref:Uncharacterized protein n=1 Tax=Zingiber officinale TaxID=94328 RepID=A0A8J5CWA5_ZINOF|nr:hypothetical protein ZIOFF_069915 [Zingiber officinale]